MLTPQLNIPDGAIADRVMAAFHGSAAEYKAWLKEQIKAKVQEHELEQIRQQSTIDQQTKAAEINTMIQDNVT